MKYNKLTTVFRNRPFFETRELNTIFDEPIGQIRARLSRWVKDGKLIQLRRGKYILPKAERFATATDGYISNYLYRPSYVSLHTALEIHGLIPESVQIVEAVTPMQTARWVTPEGHFKYYSIKASRFNGYEKYVVSKTQRQTQQNFLLATPEKALIDLFYFQKGQWTKERLEEMRFQNLDKLNNHELNRLCQTMESPKVSHATTLLLPFIDMEKMEQV